MRLMTYEWLRDWTVTALRLLGDKGNRSTIDEVMEMFGITREELDEIEPVA